MSTKKAVKIPSNTPKSVRLSIHRLPNMVKFRTKDKTLVATGHEKVQKDEDGVYRVYIKARQVYQRNLVEVESGGSVYGSARYNSKDGAKVEFLVASSLTFTGTWKAAAADLYVDGVPVWTA